MRFLLSLVLIAVLCLTAAAGDKSCGSKGCGSKGKSPCGFACKTGCPLAEEANARRSFGTEAEGTSKALCKDGRSAVERNLGKI